MDMLPLVWAGIIAFGVIMYICIDGFTLGTGMLLPFMKQDERDIAASVILPTWDGNQTWLVLGGASLYGAFPKAFAALLPILYMPIMVMVMSLLFRGVAFEFRLKSHAKGWLNWDLVFTLASLTVALSQGLILGNFIEGFQTSPDTHQYVKYLFISPFVLMCSLSVVIGYLLLGCTRLIIKTSGELQQKMYRFAKYSAIALVIALVAVSLWTPFINPLIYDRWYSGQNWVYLMVLPYLTGLAVIGLFWSLWKKIEILPYWCSIVAFICGYIGFLISLYPYLVPFHMTIWQAASPHNTLMFLLVGAVIMLPILLIYTGYSYYIFRGKVTDAIHY